MKVFTKRKNKFYSVILSTLLATQPLLAIDINANGVKLQGGGNHQPSEGVRSYIDGAKDRVPIVNINTPNQKGISHNTYKHFNVDTGGLVLNNNATNVKTQLAGWIEGNPNLRPNQEAKLILNEVVSNNPSLLKGFIEVGGKKADVIVANPNGITLNGAGFINTDKITLTTGTPFINKDGNLEKFIIEDGKISIVGDSNLLEQKRLDILSRTFEVNKKLQANELNIIVGTNEVDANSLDAKAISSDKPVPNLSVDVSSLGGMYANAIKLQATEKGVGVNMQGELLSQSNLNLDINGNLSLGGKTQAKELISNSQSADFTGSILVDNKVSIEAKDNINSKKAELKSKEISIKSTQGSIDLDTKISASDKLEVSAKQNLSLKNSIDSQNQIKLESGETQNLSGDIKTKELISNSKNTNISGNITADDKIKFSAINNIVGTSGEIASKDIDLKAEQGSIDLDVKVTASNEFKAFANKDLTIKSSINSQNLIDLQSGDKQTIKGDLQSTKIDSKSANSDINIDGKVVSHDILTLNAGKNIEINGEVSTKNLIQIDSKKNSTINGSIISKDINMVSQDGDILISKNVTASKDINLLSKNGSINILGNLDAKTILDISSGKDFSVGGYINAYNGYLKSINGNININGGITADNILSIYAKNLLNLKGDINSGNTLDISSSSINILNSKIVSKNDLKLETTKDDIVLDKSLIQSKNANIDIKSAKDIYLKNLSSISAAKYLNFITNSLELDSSNISSGNDITIQNNNFQFLNKFVNRNGSILISEDGNIELKANNILNNKSQIIAGNNIHFKTQDFENRESLVFAINSISIDNGNGGRANSILNKEADIVAYNGDLTLKANSVKNEGKAPTFIEDGYIATWYEIASGTSEEIFEDTYKLLKDEVKEPDLRPKAEFYQDYLDLLTALMKGVEPSDKSKALIKDSIKNPDGTIKAEMIGTWVQLSGKATQEGISDFDAHLKTLLVNKVSKVVPSVDKDGKPIMLTVEVDLVKADGSIDPDYIDRYVVLFEKAINGEDIPKSVLDILNNDAKDKNGNINSSITSVWDKIRTVASAGYEIKKTLVADVLNTDGALAQFIAGKNIDIDTGEMINQYANISAGGNIDIKSDTSITNSSFGASQRLHEVHKTGCFTCHEGSLGFRELFGGIIEAKGNINLTANSLANLVNGSRNMIFNLPRLDEFHDLRSNFNPVPKSFVVVRNIKANEIDDDERANLVDAKVGAINLDYIKSLSKNDSLTLDMNINDLKNLSKIKNKQPTVLDFGTYQLPTQGEKAYIETIETRYPYTNYGAFLSSDYMMKRLGYSPEHENRMNSDEWAISSPIRSSSNILAQNINLNIKDSITLDAGITAKDKLHIDSQGNLTSTAELKSGGDMSINVAQLNQIGGGIKSENLSVNTSEDLNLTGTKVRVENSVNLNSQADINLDSQRQITSGKRGDINWQNSQDIGTSLEANGTIKLNSDKSINLVASKIESLGSNVDLNANDEINLLSGENYQEFSYTRTSSKSSGFKKKTTTTNHHEEHLTHTGSVIKAKDDVNLVANSDINIEGSKLASRDENINIQTQGDVNIVSVEDKHLVEHSEHTSKSFAGIKYGSSSSNSTLKTTITKGSISEALGDISSKAGGTTTIQASKLNANGNVNIFSNKGIQILSGKDSLEYEYESKNSSLGSLLTKEQIESLQKATTVSSLINAKEVNLVTDDGIVVKGSQIQAQTVNMMAEYLALISDKNSESYSNFTDGSGVVIREIINQGYVKEEAIPSTISAQEINLNGKKLLETSLNPDNILKQISSEYNLNDEQIVQIKTELNNKEWYDKTTSLSKMGMIIVQVVSTIATYGALGTAISNISSNVMIKAAITSMVSQLGSALATSVITGNSLNVDVEKILVNSLKAAALAGVIEQIDTNLGYVGENLTYADKVSKEILHGFARASVYGGNIESILANSLGNVAFEYVGHNLYSENSQYPQIQEYVPKTLVHSIIGGTLSELAGGDFSSGAIATAVSHNVADLVGNEFLDKAVKNKLTAEQSEEMIKAISSLVSGAVTLATKENITDKELDIAQSIAESVVTNNYLKDFKAQVEFGKGIIQGGGEKLWEDLKALGVAVTSPIEAAKAILSLVSSPEAIQALGVEIALELQNKSTNVMNALFSSEAYEGEKANQAGKDLGELALTVLEAYTGVKGVTTGSKVASEVLQASKNTFDDIFNPDIIKLAGKIDPTTGKPMLDMSSLSKAQKGIMGELFGENLVKQIIPDGQKISTVQTIGGKGIDDLYKVNRPDVDYVVVEYKFNTAKQGMTNDGLQASESWITGSDRLVKSVGNEAGNVRNAIELGRTETWLVNVMPDGSSNIKVLDQYGKPKDIDTSKIILPNANYNGAVK